MKKTQEGSFSFVELYVWANSDEEAKAQAAAIASELDTKYDNRAIVKEIGGQQFRTLDLFKSVSYIFIKLEIMKKPKSREKRVAAQKRGAKRNERLKESRKKVAARRAEVTRKRVSEKLKFLELLKNLQEARAKGQL